MRTSGFGTLLTLILGIAAGSHAAEMLPPNVRMQKFGKTGGNGDVFLYTLKNSRGMVAEITNYGGILVRLLVLRRPKLRNKLALLARHEILRAKP